MAAAGTRGFVADSSAVIALVDREPGWQRVLDALDQSAISTVNLAEVQSRAALRGSDPGGVAVRLVAAGLQVEDFTWADATAAGRMRPQTRALGLSLGDRACLALALRLGRTVLTSDRALADAEVGVAVELIR